MTRYINSIKSPKLTLPSEQALQKADVEEVAAGGKPAISGNMAKLPQPRRPVWRGILCFAKFKIAPAGAFSAGCGGSQKKLTPAKCSILKHYDKWRGQK